jgi:sulfate adenylyltransferase large subunit
MVSGDIPVKKIYESDKFFAILDANPVTKGHALIIPKNHYQTIFEMPEEESAQMGKDIHAVAKMLGKEFGPHINIVNTSGEYASQSVPHYHVHLIPRQKDDRLWDGEKSKIVLDTSSGFERLKPSKEEVKELANKLMGEKNMTDTEEHLKFVIVGHVDHGKSTLIGRLFYDTGSLPEGKMEELKKTCDELGKEIEFGFIMDHLQEEREQGITIDTTQTFFKSVKRHYVIIDAPGHKEFTKNMITGASQAEAALLIVDADEGVQEQTKRHAYILSMLGLQQVIVVMNKMDLVDHKEERFKEVEKDLLAFLGSINIKPSYIIPISAKQGDNIANKSENMPWYTGLTVLEALDTFKTLKSPTELPLRYPVQDVYKFDEKRILAGRVEAGMLKKGAKLLFLPSNSESTVTAIEDMDGELANAPAGKSTGITIEHPLFIERGEVACDPSQDKPTVTTRFKGKVFWMSKLPFDKTEKIILKIATQEVECAVEKIERKLDSSTLAVLEEDASGLKEWEVGEMIFKTDAPVVIEDFNETAELGRFVLVKGEDVCAGGIVTHKDLE